MFCGQRGEAVFGIFHRLHAKAAADVGVGHADLGFIQRKPFDEVALGAPDPLPRDGDVEFVTAQFGKTAARFHRIGDDAVVVGGERDGARGSGEGGIGRGFITEIVVIGHVVGSAVVDDRAAGKEVEFDGQFINVEVDQFGGIFGLRKGVCDDERDGVAHKAHAPFGEDRAGGSIATLPIAVFDDMGAHLVGEVERGEVGGGDDGVHTGGLAGVFHVERESAMGHGGAKDKPVQRVLRCDIIGVTASAGQKALILDASDGLAGAEFRHWACLSMSAALRRTLRLRRALSSRRDAGRFCDGSDARSGQRFGELGGHGGEQSTGGLRIVQQVRSRATGARDGGCGLV